MDESTTYVAMDVHKRTIAVSARSPGGAVMLAFGQSFCGVAQPHSGVKLL
jgi:hypothetical protein